MPKKFRAPLRVSDLSNKKRHTSKLYNSRDFSQETLPNTIDYFTDDYYNHILSKEKWPKAPPKSTLKNHHAFNKIAIQQIQMDIARRTYGRNRVVSDLLTN